MGILQLRRYPLMGDVSLFRPQKSRIVLRLKFPDFSLRLDELTFRCEVLTLDVSEPLTKLRYFPLILFNLFHQSDVVCPQFVVVRSQCFVGGFEIRPSLVVLTRDR